MNYLFFTLFISCICFSCKQNETTEKKVEQLTFQIPVYSDESFLPLLEEERYVFEARNPGYFPQFTFSTEAASIEALFDRKTDVIIIGRNLTNDELNYLKGKSLIPKINPMASDAIAFVVNKSFNDTITTADQLMNWLKNGKYIFVTDKAASTNMRWLADKAGLNQTKDRIFSVGNNEKVIEYVTSHQNAIGVIGLNWISNFKGKDEKERLKSLNSIGFIVKDSLGTSIVTYPYQSYIAEKNYPFIREILIVNVDANEGPGTTFAAFLLGEVGQKIVLKAGLLPWKMPGREMEMIGE
jgi:phosphate transport system substrate-binding protein